MKRWLDRLRGRAPAARDARGKRPGWPARDEGTQVLAALDDEGTQAVPVPGSATDVLPVLGFLTVVEGPTALLGRRYALRDAEISIGRAPDCYVAIPDPSVSRLHAQIQRRGADLVLVHRSGTNATLVNTALVEDEVRLRDGDQVQLAGRVVLRLEAPSHRRSDRTSLQQVMQARVELDERIEADFVRTGSFLDVDVHDSFGLKASEPRADRVVVSFERFRAFLEERIEDHAGRILNSNGDEVMAFFSSADDAVAAARAVLEDLAPWNEGQNLLPAPFQVRMGIHTGRSAVDLERGVAYSPVLDGAGHLQKEAAPGSFLVSETTRDALSQPDRFREAGFLQKDQIRYFRPEPGA